jgi:RepB DNA-primase from phage plasmid
LSDIAAAKRMLDTFTSVGADSFVVTKTELEWPGHKKVKWGKTYSLSELQDKLPAMMRTAAIRRPIPLEDGQTVLAGENLIIRPISDGVGFIQLDDLKPDQLDRVRPAVFIMHATSPGNYQAWIAVSGLPEGKAQFKEFVRRVRKAVGGTDKSASHATRLAGTENFKTKYLPEFPTVTILETHPDRVMTPEQLEAMGLVAAPEPEITAPAFTARTPQGRTGQQSATRAKVWPDYARSLAGAPPSRDGSGPDRSMADFTWCMTAIDWGFPIEETAAKLPQVSEKARERVQDRDEKYPLITAQNAAAAVERNALKRGRG